MSELVDDLRAQMRAATQHDAAPLDLARRARGAVQRRRQRGAVLLTTAAVAGTALLVVPALGPGEGPRRTVAVQPAPDAVQPAQAGPTDADVAQARWWGYTTEAAQPLLEGADAEVGAGQYAGRLWFGRDGAVVQVRADGSSTTGTSTALWQLRGRRLAWDAVRALPDDVAGWRGVLATPTAPDDLGALSEPANLLRGAPLTSGQRRALVQALGELPGVETAGAARDARGRSGRLLVERAGDLRTSYLLADDDRLLELRRRVGGTERVLTFSGWTTTGPPAEVQPAPVDAGPDDAQLAGADWYGVRLLSGAPDGTVSTSRRWVARAGGSVAEAEDGTLTREPETAGWPVGDRFLTWADVRALPEEPGELRRVIGAQPPEVTLDAGLDLLTWAPLDRPQRAALAEVLRGLDGLVVTQGTAESTGRAGERWRLERADGTVVTAWWRAETARVLEVVRSAGGTRSSSTFSGWTVEPPPA